MSSESLGQLGSWIGEAEKLQWGTSRPLADQLAANLEFPSLKLPTFESATLVFQLLQSPSQLRTFQLC